MSEYEYGAVAEGTDSHPSQHSITENSFLASQTLALPSSNSSRHEAEDEAALIYSGIDNKPVDNSDLQWKFYHAVCVDHALSDYSPSDIVHELLHWSVFHSTLQLTNTEDSPSSQSLDAVSVFHSAMSFLSASGRLELASAITHAHSTSIYANLTLSQLAFHSKQYIQGKEFSSFMSSTTVVSDKQTQNTNELKFRLSSESSTSVNSSDSFSNMKHCKLSRLLSHSLLRKLNHLKYRKNAMQAFRCAFSTTTSTSAFPFDSYSVFLIVDTGASAAFTYCLRDFTSFTPIRVKVDGLGSMAVKGIGTVQYQLVTDKGTTETLEIKGVYYVPQLKVRLLSPQQVCRQSSKPCLYEGNDSHFKLRWNSHCKTISYSKDTNLAMLYTAPGSALATNLMAHYSTVAPNDSISCFRCAKTVPQYNLLDPSNPTLLDEHITLHPEMMAVPFESEKEITLKCSMRHCVDCNRVDVSSNEKFDVKLLSTLTDAQRKLLHIHESMGHPNFHMLQDLALRGIIPKRLAHIEPPQCLSCHLGKAHKVARSTNNTIINERIKRPGDLIHIDQAETSTPGRPMTYSGRNSPDKITCFTLFVDSISKKVFVNFQHSTSTQETLFGKQ